jgi:hypothetical protein
MEVRSLQINNLDDYNGVTNFGSSGANPNPGAIAGSVIMALGFLNDLSLSYRINKEVDKLRRNIAAELFDGYKGVCYEPGIVGVLVANLAAEYRYIDAPPRRYVGTWIADKGLDYITTLKRYISTPKIEPGVPPGFDKIWFWLWITKL